MTTNRLPENLTLYRSREEIDREVERLGREIAHWISDREDSAESDVLCLPILRGALFFCADLLRAIPASVELQTVRVRSYVVGENAKQSQTVDVALDQLGPLAGRSILLVDDICDSGRTLAVLSEMLLGKGAKEVRSAVLVDRREGEYSPHYCAFEYPGKEWFVGVGMDDKERYRNLPDLYLLTP